MEIFHCLNKKTERWGLKVTSRMKIIRWYFIFMKNLTIYKLAELVQRESPWLWPQRTGFKPGWRRWKEMEELWMEVEKVMEVDVWSWRERWNLWRRRCELGMFWIFQHMMQSFFKSYLIHLIFWIYFIKLWKTKTLFLKKNGKIVKRYKKVFRFLYLE